MIRETIFYILGCGKVYKNPACKYWMNSNTCRYDYRYPQLGERVPGIGIFYQIKISDLIFIRNDYFKGR